jgi:SAM-dependent methyltransferase
LTEINTRIWQSLYEGGNYLHYPSEVFVQLYFRTLGKARKSGKFLDHGCGSGNNSEFLARQGWAVVGTDISQKALELQKARLTGMGGPHAQVLIRPDAALSGQLDRYDHILAWDSLCYNRLAKARVDSEYLATSLNKGGYLFVNMPTLRHEFAAKGSRRPDGSFENNRPGTHQEGAIMTIPDSLDDLCSWFPALKIVERGYFTFDFNGFREFMIVVAQKTDER